MKRTTSKITRTSGKVIQRQVGSIKATRYTGSHTTQQLLSAMVVYGD